MRCLARYIFTTSPPRAGTIEFTPTPATYAPSAARNFSGERGYAALTIARHAQLRNTSFVAWQAIARPSMSQRTAARWWKKTPTAWKKWPKSGQGRSGSGGGQHEVRAETEQQSEQQRPGDERRHR